MKFLFTADVHLKMWNDKVYNDNGLPLRLVEILSTIEQMCVYARDNSINKIIVGGDLNDTKGIASVRAFVLFKDLVEKYSDIKFYLLHGNHDAVSSQYNNTESAVQLITGPDNVTAITETSVIDNILFVPYSKSILEELEKHKKSNCNILVSHFGLNEGSLSSGISLKSTISASNLSKFDLVLLGHYHKPQKIEYGDTNIYYVGSPIPIRRDEYDEQKRFLVVDQEDCTVEEIDTTGYRRYFQFVLDEDADVNEIKEQIEKYSKEGHYVVVKNTLSNIPKQLNDVVDSVQYVDLYEPDVNIRGIDVTMSIEKQLEKYIDIERIPDDEKDEYFKVGMECITISTLDKEEVDEVT